jgi:hypothetical protein
MASESHLCFILFESKSLHRVVTACCENVFVLDDNETIDGGFMIIEVTAIV